MPSARKITKNYLMKCKTYGNSLLLNKLLFLGDIFRIIIFAA